MPPESDLIGWLRAACSEYRFAPRAVFRRGLVERWPLRANDENELERELRERGHFLPLPKEPAALANVVEVSIVDFLLDRFAREDGIEVTRGTERGYPDLEISGSRFGGAPHALDIKVARRARGGRNTQSRITLYTGNTYFAYPQLRWPSTLRPFEDYRAHIALLVLYTFDPDDISRVRDLELLVHDTWRVASKKRSSETREYIGAVTSIERLRRGDGDFASEEEFYAFWRKYHFKVGRSVRQQLQKLLERTREDGRSG